MEQEKKWEASLEANVRTVQQAFIKDVTLKLRGFENQQVQGLRGIVCYIEGMVDGTHIAETVIRPLIGVAAISQNKMPVTAVMEDVLCAPELEKTDCCKKALDKMASGDCLILLDNCNQVIIVGAKGFAMRSVSEPDNERILKGPREGFCENIMVNTSLLRRKVQNNLIKFEFLKIGEVYETTVCISYIDGAVDKRVLEELRQRLQKVRATLLLDSNYIAEQIKDHPMSPMKTVGTTERPDIAVAKMLEGRICILVDGSPICLTVPHLFLELFQSAEDYYINFYYSSFQRVVRMLGFLLSIALPAAYIALVCFSQEMLPSALALSVAKARVGLPFTTVMEAVALLVIFDVLRESGARSPSNMGQALSVVSSIVLGQAAIEAGFVSSPMLIVIALSGVTSVLVPKVIGMTILAKYALLAVAAVFGMTGLGLGLLLLLTYMASLDSFGVPYLSYFYPDKQANTGDSFFRVSWKKLTATPIFKK